MVRWLLDSCSAELSLAFFSQSHLLNRLSLSLIIINQPCTTFFLQILDPVIASASDLRFLFVTRHFRQFSTWSFPEPRTSRGFLSWNFGSLFKHPSLMGRSLSEFAFWLLLWWWIACSPSLILAFLTSCGLPSCLFACLMMMMMMTTCTCIKRMIPNLSRA